LHLTREKKNVDGPFYTLEDVCLACRIPETEAPTLLSQDDDNCDTYFIKQPITKKEIEEACCAIESCCADALRYGGQDKEIISRLKNNPNYCDYDLEGNPTLKTSNFLGNRINKFWITIKYLLAKILK